MLTYLDFSNLAILTTSATFMMRTSWFRRLLIFCKHRPRSHNTWRRIRIVWTVLLFDVAVLFHGRIKEFAVRECEELVIERILRRAYFVEFTDWAKRLGCKWNSLLGMSFLIMFRWEQLIPFHQGLRYLSIVVIVGFLYVSRLHMTLVVNNRSVIGSTFTTTVITIQGPVFGRLCCKKVEASFTTWIRSLQENNMPIILDSEDVKY